MVHGSPNNLFFGHNFNKVAGFIVETLYGMLVDNKCESFLASGNLNDNICRPWAL